MLAGLGAVGFDRIFFFMSEFGCAGLWGDGFWKDLGTSLARFGNDVGIGRILKGVLIMENGKVLKDFRGFRGLQF